MLFSFTATALEPVIPLTDEISHFVSYISSFYNDEYDAYTMYNDEGIIITENTYKNTKQFASQNDWLSVYNYFSDNVYSTAYLQLGFYPTRTLEVTKWDQVTIMSAPLKAISGPSYDLHTTTAYITIGGTITYNPNTKIIFSTSEPYVSTQCTPVGSITRTENYVYRSNYKATFKVTGQPTAEASAGGVPLGTVYFPSVTGVLEIVPD